MSLATAREEARRLRDLAARGIDPRRARASRRASTTTTARSAPAKHTVGALAAEFMDRYVKPNRKRPEDAEWLLGRDILREWRDRDARSITTREVIDLLDGIVDRGAPIQANRTAAILSQMFRFGIQRRIVEQNPVQLLVRPGGRERPRERVLTDNELRTFLADPVGCTRYERLSHVMTILLLTGQRRGELAAARWAEIDLAVCAWEIPAENSKTGRGHTVPLSSWAGQEFEALKRLAGQSRFVLPMNDGKTAASPALLTRGLARCLSRFKARGIDPFTLHDLRRTCRTGLSRLKVEPHIAERVLNHVQPGIVGVYDRHAYLDEKREALEAWAAHLGSLRAGHGITEET
jgi:integrase